MAPELLERAAALRLLGWSYRRIASALGYASHTPVRLALVRALGITPSATERRTREAVRLQDQGVPGAVVAERLGYAGEYAVYMWRKRQQQQDLPRYAQAAPDRPLVAAGQGMAGAGAAGDLARVHAQQANPHLRVAERRGRVSACPCGLHLSDRPRHPVDGMIRRRVRVPATAWPPPA
jgi:hypothetical protein